MLCLTDFMATVAEIVGFQLPIDPAEDSYDMSEALFGADGDSPVREATVHHGSRVSRCRPAERSATVERASPGRKPIWMAYLNGEHFGGELALFAHEFIHTCPANLSDGRHGRIEPLTDANCACHWRAGLHTPAALPWRGGRRVDHVRLGRGGFWRDNGDATFTLVARYTQGGHSWLDVYVMGLAAAWEVPDPFLLRNRRRIASGRVAGDNETISIKQIVAASGPRSATVATSQQVFNAGLVYLLEPGKNPSANLRLRHIVRLPISLNRTETPVLWDTGQWLQIAGHSNPQK